MDLSQQLFAVPSSRKEADIVIQAVPWDVTTSYGGGTSRGPQAILAASAQVDLYDLDTSTTYETGYFLDKENPYYRRNNKKFRKMAQKIMQELFKNEKLSAASKKQLAQVNGATQKMVAEVQRFTQQVLHENKIPGLIGGDHSTPLGAIAAIGEHTRGQFGVLHLDAHADLREAYQGFHHSHASIMRNVCELKHAPQTLVQVGIRDFCMEELDYIYANSKRIHTYFDAELKKSMFEGTSWKALCEKIISHLPDQVYLSFDIDGLSPEFCPHTGTPVPGGLSFDQASYLLGCLGRSGRTIVGFDLNEVAPGPAGNEWDGNVGARLLFKMCNWTRYTHRHIRKM